MKCGLCNLEMNEAHGCKAENVRIKYDAVLRRIAYQVDGLEMPDRCHDCGAKVGEIHHRNCDMEKCPVCGRQFITCPHCPW